ncbi:LacI family DNA-binding transcriptional regulator [Luteipulveratus flavus]|uniref:LacI family DNA-binding transcriptional regulator n=1 Tax=Luteipulveratus flavus TaxID=3031728 RepID=A0ABT6C2N8_9MICO|nr:LacI family DNA-binding transcriptional regulator [Luteipulveratus sp. YIM 133296]MDF8262950.1 LacI family DNA-binding transcriptional regulator [Luteipulveratus sp. YIM 133296]
MAQGVQGRVTLKDVAARVGISPAAVSMALSGRSRISAATVEQVKAAAAELGYVPSSAAKALRNQRSGVIAVIVPNSTQHVFGHSYFMQVLTGVSSAANERDLQVLVSTSASEASGLTAYERVMRSRTADGAIVTSSAIGDPNIERLTAGGLAVVLIGNYPELPGTTSVGIDDVAASRMVTEHLIEVHGKRSLLHVTGPLDHQTAVDRREGFLDAVRAHGLLAASDVVEGDFSERAGYDALDGRRLGADGFDGVVFANDDMAFGGLQLLRRTGLSVPGDVAVVGFDDFGLSRITDPGITTVHVPAEQMARLAAERLIPRIEDPTAAPTRDDLEVSLVLRESCGCAREDVVLLRN